MTPAAKTASTAPVSADDLTIKGAGVPDKEPEPAEPKSENMALSTPLPGVPVATSVVGQQNTHQPPDLDDFDKYGRAIVE